MVFLLFFAFVSGLVTILAPCIWPLLPIILSSSVAGKNHIRPLGITLGIMLSFSVFTLTISYLVRLFHFDPNILRLAAVIVLGFLGLTMIIPAWNRFLEGMLSRLSGAFGGKTQTENDGFAAGFITGLSLGIVWSPCAGPILAAIATLAATGQVSTSVIFITLAYITGIGIPLFIFAYGGQQVVARTRFLSRQTGHIQQIFGVIMIITAIAIYTNYDTYILNKIPDFSANINQLANNKTIKGQLDNLRGKKATPHNLFDINTPAPEFTGISKWLNTDKLLTMRQLRGKVVLIDFWTYTCINCIRTLPHVTSWYDKYKNRGLVVIGVHTPEFEFEKNTDNVLNAIKQFNIHYPVAQDNAYATWNVYNNQYWPAEYLIDAKGAIRRTHFGEGEYDQTEQAIQALLNEAGSQVNTGLINMPDETPHGQLSPESYLGVSRMQFFYPNGTAANGNQTFTLTKNIPPNTFSFGGNWNITAENAITDTNAVLEYNFIAQKVFLVLRPPKTGSGTIKIFLDGKPVDEKTQGAGNDVKNGIITVDNDRLYNLINLRGSTENHLLRLEFQTPGIEVFAFTFG